MALPPIKQRIPLISIPSNATIRDAMRAIDRGAVGFSLLIEPDTVRFVGLVSDGDIRRALLKGLGMESSVADVPRPTTQVASVNSPPEDVAAMFSEYLRVVPLLDDSNRVVDLAVLDHRVRLPVAEPILGERELQYVSECVLTGWVSSAGKFVKQFEDMFADFCGVDHAVAVANGTVALHLALATLGIGPGDEVVVPTLTFAATANAVIYTSARPVFVDSDPDTWTMDPGAVKEAISPRTRAIIPVHLYGHPVDMDPIMDMAEQHGLWVVEDSAEAHGSRYKGQRVGSIGHFGCFSFYGNKIITTGEGGMLTTNDSTFAEKARVLRNQGMSRDNRYWHTMVGFNYRLTNLQAAIGVAQMEQVTTILSRRGEMQESYNRNLDGLGIRLPPNADWAEPVCWLYTVLLDDSQISRDEVIDLLEDQGVETRRVFYPLSDMPPYKGFASASFPIAEEISRKGISLPSSVTLTDRDVVDITRKLQNILR